MQQYFFNVMDKWMRDELREEKAIEYGIIGTNNSSNKDAIKARLGIGTAPTTRNIMNAKDIYGKRFWIPLDFELFTRALSPILSRF